MPHVAATIPELAARQLHDFDARTPGLLFRDAAIELTISEAYALQFEVARLRESRGEAIAGYKIGCASPVMQAQLGMNEPVFGHIFQTELHRSGVTLDTGKYDGLALEGEFAVRMAGDAQSVDSEFAIIELHNYVIRRPPLSAQELIANNAIHAGLVLPLDFRRVLGAPEALLDEPITILHNGETAGNSTGRALPGGPLASIETLTKHLARFGRRLLPGQIILTGSPLPLYRVGPGDSFEVRTEHLETVKALISGERR